MLKIISIIIMWVSNPVQVPFLGFHPHTFIINDVISYWLQVNLKYEDDTPVDCKGSGRQVIKKNCSKLMLLNMQIKILHMIEKSLFSIGALPQVKNEFTVVVEDFSTGK